MDSSNDRQRKDRLIQTRVPQNLESTLKDEARKRRLSVSHLIRNVLEDTFNLVDNVVVDLDGFALNRIACHESPFQKPAPLMPRARVESKPTGRVSG